MKYNFRVIVSGNTGDGLFYRIEDVCEKPTVSPFFKHSDAAGSIKELKERLAAMIDACEKPPMAVRTTLVDVPGRHQ